MWSDKHAATHFPLMWNDQCYMYQYIFGSTNCFQKENYPGHWHWFVVRWTRNCPFLGHVRLRCLHWIFCFIFGIKHLALNAVVVYPGHSMFPNHQRTPVDHTRGIGPNHRKFGAAASFSKSNNVFIDFDPSKYRQNWVSKKYFYAALDLRRYSWCIYH